MALELDYSAMQLTTDPQPVKVYYSLGKHTSSRKEQKRELLLAFINHSTQTKRKPTRRSAPVKPSLLRSLLSLFI